MRWVSRVEAMDASQLPPPPAPAGAYLPAASHAGVVYSAGMTTREGGVPVVTGRVGDGVTLDEARRGAAIAARNALSAVAAEAGGVGNVRRLLRVAVYVQCAADFTDISRVADAASEALTAVLGERGRAARTALGVYALPGDSAVEVDLVAACGTPEAPS